MQADKIVSILEIFLKENSGKLVRKALVVGAGLGFSSGITNRITDRLTEEVLDEVEKEKTIVERVKGLAKGKKNTQNEKGSA